MLREPLVHFLLAGLALFAGYARLHPDADASRASRRIELGEEDVRQLALGWRAQGRPEPTADELRSLVEARVREEILYREALALGLDRDDTIVRRRLAQKMEFLADDPAAVPEPTRDELRAWFASHAERFASPARASFHHFYFSTDRRGARARDDAAAALARIAGAPPAEAAAAGLGDPFMYQDAYPDRPREAVAGVFGAAFAAALFELPTGAWQGPIESGYGWHLVFLDALEPARTPAFEAVEAEVRAEWVAEQRAAARERTLRELRARYEVVLPAPPAPSVTASR